MRLILLRHGETLWNKEHRLQGHLNSPLSEKGIAQAKAIKPLIEKFSLKQVICSDLERAKQTAELIGFPNATPDSHLRELAMGEWEGRKKDEIMQEHPILYQDWRNGNYTPRGGESWQDFCHRISTALFQWTNKSDGDILAIVHSGVVRAACERLISLSTKHLLPVTQATLTIFDITPNYPIKLEAYNLGNFVPEINVAD
ncbi:histidine phosphatase family protein [Aggregatibacter actinomycetemcomitans]|uniref:histidine phosphatase family protein n=1 Tax=Aggregatibacter actinomycetemcomitans TaxID=714 RepID=UPI0011D885C4|nr:histidine phosphatase family protein [Aggregatibacter actinomycetemcomitans]TYA52124.1 histidine phosphatase family protein [Aggregatibacter actinomycetemcomitans]